MYVSNGDGRLWSDQTGPWAVAGSLLGGVREPVLDPSFGYW
jgi:hypothetical protein